MKLILLIDFQVGDNASEQNLDYESLSKPCQNKGFQANENQTVNLQDDNFSLENINFGHDFKEFDEWNFGNDDTIMNDFFLQLKDNE